jgi:hypothetical protein
MVWLARGTHMAQKPSISATLLWAPRGPGLAWGVLGIAFLGTNAFLASPGCFSGHQDGGFAVVLLPNGDPPIGSRHLLTTWQGPKYPKDLRGRLRPIVEYRPAAGSSIH